MPRQIPAIIIIRAAIHNHQDNFLVLSNAWGPAPKLDLDRVLHKGPIIQTSHNLGGKSGSPCMTIRGVLLTQIAMSSSMFQILPPVQPAQPSIYAPIPCADLTLSCLKGSSSIHSSWPRPAHSNQCLPNSCFWAPASATSLWQKPPSNFKSVKSKTAWHSTWQLAVPAAAGYSPPSGFGCCARPGPTLSAAGRKAGSSWALELEQSHMQLSENYSPTINHILPCNITGTSTF